MFDAELINTWTENFVVESHAIRTARHASIEHGVEPITPAVGSYLSSLVAMTGAQSVVEIGSGLGVASQWLLHGNPELSLTTIEKDVDHLQSAKDLMAEAGIPSTRVRGISGDASAILPRMNEGMYDMVVVNSVSKGVLEFVRHAFRLARPGGLVVVTHALGGGHVANPAKRDAVTTELRTVLGDYAADDNVRATLVPVGDGVLTLVKN
jgi:predicted O-methyltransferase YrrM